MLMITRKVERLSAVKLSIFGVPNELQSFQTAHHLWQYWAETEQVSGQSKGLFWWLWYHTALLSMQAKRAISSFNIWLKDVDIWHAVTEMETIYLLFSLTLCQSVEMVLQTAGNMLKKSLICRLVVNIGHIQLWDGIEVSDSWFCKVLCPYEGILVPWVGFVLKLYDFKGVVSTHCFRIDTPWGTFLWQDYSQTVK